MRRWLRALVWVSVIATFAVPAAADDFTGSEKEMRTLSCPAEGRSVPKNQEPPGPGECDEDSEETYQGYVWTNNVKCNSAATADAHGVRIYHSNTGTTSGGVGICNDGTGTLGGAVPIQGRAVAQGSQDGGHVYVDGEKDNTQHEALTSFARADGKIGAGNTPPFVNLWLRCADAGGRQDASERTEDDDQSDCASTPR